MDGPLLHPVGDSDQEPVGQVEAHSHPGLIPVGALHPVGITDDPRCPYSVIAKMWWRDARHLTGEQRACTAIFRHASGIRGYFPSVEGLFSLYTYLNVSSMYLLSCLTIPD